MDHINLCALQETLDIIRVATRCIRINHLYGGLLDRSDLLLVAITEVIMDNTREDGKPAHEWVLGKDAGFDRRSVLYTMYLCKNCGVLKGYPKNPETPCKGKVKVTLR